MQHLLNPATNAVLSLHYQHVWELGAQQLRCVQPRGSCADDNDAVKGLHVASRAAAAVARAGWLAGLAACGASKQPARQFQVGGEAIEGHGAKNTALQAIGASGMEVVSEPPRCGCG